MAWFFVKHRDNFYILLLLSTFFYLQRQLFFFFRTSNLFIVSLANSLNWRSSSKNNSLTIYPFWEYEYGATTAPFLCKCGDIRFLGEISTGRI
jgi:hypothetical protein